jgi:hypothetical protein
VNAWTATEITIAVAVVVAPSALVLIVALLRGYSVQIWRRERPPAVVPSDDDTV